MSFREIKKVRKEGNIKKITIPKNCDIEEGDFVNSTGYYKTNENVQTNLAVQSKEVNHQ